MRCVVSLCHFSMEHCGHVSLHRVSDHKPGGHSSLLFKYSACFHYSTNRCPGKSHLQTRFWQLTRQPQCMWGGQLYLLLSLVRAAGVWLTASRFRLIHNMGLSILTTDPDKEWITMVIGNRLETTGVDWQDNGTEGGTKTGNTKLPPWLQHTDYTEERTREECFHVVMSPSFRP